MRFYIEGLELDIQDSTFFMDEEEDTDTHETLDEMLNAYTDLPVAQ